MSTHGKGGASKKSIFIAATRQNDGKTMVSMGLFNAFQKRLGKVAYMKPVGQQYKLVNDKKIDKDAILFKKTYDLPDNLHDMSPVAVPKGFTEQYILDPNLERLQNKIQVGFDQLTADNDFVLIEGTGHAGVGSVFNMSNGDVAKQLKTKVVLVSLGGIGRAIDEIMLNKACFDMCGVEIIGVIINKVRSEKFEKIQEMSKKGLERQGIRVLGTIPFVNMLTKPTVLELYESLGAQILSGEEYLLNSVDKFFIGDMLPHDAINNFTKNTLLILPYNQEGLVMTAASGTIMSDIDFNVSAIIFTGGGMPHKKILEILQYTKIPILFVQEDSFSVATKINNMLVKLRSEEHEKIDKIQELIEQYVDVDQICSIIQEG